MGTKASGSLARVFPAIVCGAVLGLGLTAGRAADAASGTPRASHAGDNFALLERCSKCHNSEDGAGGIAFDTIPREDIPSNAESWEKVVGELRGRLMPIYMWHYSAGVGPVGG